MPLLQLLLQDAPGLTSIDLSRLRQPHRCRYYSSCCKMPRLTSIDLSRPQPHRCRYYSSCCKMPRADFYQSLRQCRNLTDAAITALAANCPGLTSIDLSECENLTDAAITALAARCPGLTSIDFSGCRNLTDAAITALAARCPDIHSDIQIREGLS